MHIPARHLLAVGLCALAACARVGQEPPRLPVFYPLPPEPPRIQFLTSIASAADLPSTSSLLADIIIGAPEAGPRIWKPYGVAMHGSRLYVCDTIINNVLVFDLDSGDARLLSSNLGGDALRQPINIAVAPDGMIYVADADRGQVVVFGPNERFVTAFGDPATVSPCDVAVAGDRLAVADLAGNQIEIWDRATGEVLGVYGEQGNGLGQFQAPTNLAIAPDGTLCVSETHNFRVQRMDLDGNPISSFGGLGTGFGQFTRPKGVAVDPAGRVYVVDAAFSNVQVFGPDDELLIFLGGPGSDVSNLDLPADVEIVSDPDLVRRFEQYVAPGHRITHLILVSSQFGVPRVNIYGFLDQGEMEGGARPLMP